MTSMTSVTAVITELAGRFSGQLLRSADPVAAAYGPNYRRLREIKTKHDPGNFCHMNQNIRPMA